MTRYISTLPRAMESDRPDASQQIVMLGSIQVIDNLGRDTGLLDARGMRLFAIPDPIGFGRRSDA